ncbi:alpha-ketoacid dehydrogenase kinase [Cylindrobasidium torrendii FP15055 ss-10]|uniref:Protein-serine/threonine kinase n=1 Tax=Cylindrobasidium torrendii FP15055 ss-10 TaxID=1314674 RepID=A0A0D7BU71_9AGAR|nr:alpha-ketoacid dehydrogenase kinase [Cylindrobasidium torrendii FP15055 ss-10]
MATTRKCVTRVQRVVPSQQKRAESTALHFYQNRQLELYASRELRPLSLRQLIFFGRSLTESRLLTSANYVRTELPVRIAHRLRDLQALPYVVVTQEGVARVYELYWSAFEQFRRYPQVNTPEENKQFCDFTRRLLDEHASVIPNLYLGLSLSSPYLPPEQLDRFMRKMLTTRISRRVLVEHHIALSEAYSKGGGSNPTEQHVGIISTGLNVGDTVRRCIDLLRRRPLPSSRTCWSEVVIDGHPNTKLPYIQEHLEYIVFELLKNSLDATLKRHVRSTSLPPVRITISEGVNDVGIRVSDQGGGLSLKDLTISRPEDLFSFSHVRNAKRLHAPHLEKLRSVANTHQGLKATVHEQVAKWNGRNASTKDAQDGREPRLGIGLPMSNIYSTYFGGKLELMSLDGWGTDVYLRLPKLGTNLEGIEV